MNQEIIFIILFIRYLILSEWHVADCYIKKIIRIVCFFKTGYFNIRFRIELSCNPARNTIQLHTIKSAFLHLLRQHSEEISDTHCRFYVPTDFDTKEKALSGAKAAEKGLK